MRNLSKPIKRKLRELAETAYEREMTTALDDLYGAFDEWKTGKISCFDLSDIIHTYHQKTARRIWSRYSGNDPEFKVVLAARDGVLTQDEIPEDVAGAIDLARRLQ